MGSDEVKFHSVDSALTDTTDHNRISLSIFVDKALQDNSKIVSNILTKQISRILTSV